MKPCKVKFVKAIIDHYEWQKLCKSNYQNVNFIRHKHNNLMIYEKNDIL